MIVSIETDKAPPDDTSSGVPLASWPFVAPDQGARILIALVALTPITALAGALVGLASLQTLTVLGIFPAMLAAGCVALAHPSFGRLALLGVVAGLAATSAYDAFRLGITWVLGLADPILGIGQMLLGPEANAWSAGSAGYMYRFFGDGAGMAVAFAMGGRYGLRPGLAFGTALCGCLWALLLLFPSTQLALFPLTPAVLGMTMVGHWIYGGVAGSLLAYWHRDRTPFADAAFCDAREPDEPALTLTVTEGPSPLVPADTETVSAIS